MAITEDYDVFFAEHGDAATLGVTALRGILEEGPELVFGNAIGGNDPRFHCRFSALPADPRGLALAVGSRNFTVRDWQHDGAGVAILTLETA